MLIEEQSYNKMQITVVVLTVLHSLKCLFAKTSEVRP